jgi:hypothetical protein
MLVARTTAVAAAIVLSVGTAAWAQGRTDVVTLLNGDRITGEIRDLNRGRLEFKTDDAGTIEIEWDKVATLVAARSFEVETSDGRRLLGNLGASAEKTLAVAAADGVVPLSMPDVTRITPIGASFWAKLEGSVDAGFSYTRSSGVTQTTLNTDTIYRQPAFLFKLSSSATVTERNDGTEADDRSAVSFAYNHYRRRRLLIGGYASLESNESLGLRLRSQVGGVVGLRLVNSNHAQVEFSAGLVVNDERGVDSEATRNVEGILGLTGSYYTYDRPRTTIDGRVQYFPSLSNRGRRRLQTDGDVRRELWKDFFVALNVFYIFDSEPPNPDAERIDVGTVVSLGWSF